MGLEIGAMYQLSDIEADPLQRHLQVTVFEILLLQIHSQILDFLLFLCQCGDIVIR